MLHVPQTEKLLNFRGKHSPNNSDLKIDTDALLSITEPQHGHVVCNFWHSLCRGQREICTVSCYSFTEQMFWRKLANGEIFSFHLSDGSIVIKPAHLFNLNAAGGDLRSRVLSFNAATRVAEMHQACMWCMCMQKKKEKKRKAGTAGPFIISL